MKYSKQREIILKYVKSVNTHPTAETIYEEVRKKDDKISLGTVYRNLEKLYQNGDIKRIKMANTKDRFDGFTDNHYHGICTKCGKLVDIFVDYYKDIDKYVSKSTGIDILSHDITFNVICPECKKIREDLLWN